ncbi:hypothetical protein CRG98_024365 [Punica granatum]|uniref:Uncharacterized protein n=1 Tax=Punica granatum TaxID=22663 RepID=A0A2I0JG91_PUNGR|nr:hypothetical protein CRG98_024365 [Punica granatum]
MYGGIRYDQRGATGPVSDRITRSRGRGFRAAVFARTRRERRGGAFVIFLRSSGRRNHVGGVGPTGQAHVLAFASSAIMSVHTIANWCCPIN